LRLLVFLTQIYRNENIKELKEYLLTNWFNIVMPSQPISPDRAEDIEDLQSDGSNSEHLKED
jgi:hypothetical protein